MCLFAKLVDQPSWTLFKKVLHHENITEVAATKDSQVGELTNLRMRMSLWLSTTLQVSDLVG